MATTDTMDTITDTRTKVDTPTLTKMTPRKVMVTRTVIHTVTRTVIETLMYRPPFCM